MKTKFYFKAIALFLASAILFTSCSSTTLIQSTPPGAAVYVDMQKIGTTPCSYSDSKIVGSTTNLTLKKDGYQDLNVMLTRNERADVGAIIAGVFFLVPFFWVCAYNSMHNYELTPLNANNNNAPVQPQQAVPTNNPTINPAPVTNAPATNINADKSTVELGKLKKLADDNVITQSEYNTLKANVLDGKYNYDNSAADQISKLKSWLDQNLISKEDFAAKKAKIISGK